MFVSLSVVPLDRDAKMPRKKKEPAEPLNFLKKNKNNVGLPHQNPHVPFGRRSRRRHHLLPIEPSGSYMSSFRLDQEEKGVKIATTKVKAPFKEGLQFKVDTPPKTKLPEIGQMMFFSPTKSKVPAWTLQRMSGEWPTWTKKSWQNVVQSSLYLTTHPKVLQKIINTESPTLHIKNKMRIGGEKLACLLTGSIRFNKNLIHLNLCSCSLNSDAVVVITAALEPSHKVQTLNLSDNFIQAEGAKAVSKLLRKNKSIKFLSLRNTRLTDMSTNYTGVASLAVGLRLNTMVEQMDLATNGLQRQGAMILCNVLQHNWRIEMINLEDNHLCDDDVKTCLLMVKKAEIEMETFRNSIKLAVDFDVNTRSFHLGEIEMQPSLLIQNTRWEQREHVTEETCMAIELAGLQLTKARWKRYRAQKLQEAQRFRLPRRKPPPYVPPQQSSAWEVLGRLREKLGKRVAKHLIASGIRVPENFADEDWHLSEEEKIEKERLKNRKAAGLVNSNEEEI